MDKIIKKQYHNIQMKRIRMISQNSSVNKDIDSYNESKIEVETSIGNFIEIVNPKEGKTFLKTKVEGLYEDEIVFNIEVVYEGQCVAEHELEKKELEFYLKIQSVPMLWSYVRETINNVMLKMNLEPVLLPVLNISDMINDLHKLKDGDRGDM